LAYYEPEQGWLFSGDVIFGLGCGRVFEGTYEQQFESLQKIKSLPDRTLIFCAHEYTEANLRFLRSLGPLSPEQEKYAAALQAPSVPLSLSTEKKCNPFLLAENLEQFTVLRNLRNRFS